MIENQNMNETATNDELVDEQLEQIAGGGFRRSRSAWQREMEKLEKEKERQRQQQQQQQQAAQELTNPPTSAN